MSELQMSENILRCGACGATEIDGTHSCIEKMFLLPLEYKNRFYKTALAGHSLIYFLRKVYS